ncbi:peptidylprolyl isomerase [Pseudoroseicyclus tamaricis]|uniref:Peptidylprolyl isomerase n=1 Tax=Pseudoroseicyclus tamaricis TaxID=2705421 RepID=A0A6B2JPZ1_9RHOB|nr:peptidylprolyl isomerase [Pseudoroseicyclus tamaricis]NDV00747.1 peptidylprolyl isomerase [Pseudoroseicyclus tamaricis]
MAKRKSSNIALYIILGLLIVGLMGFGGASFSSRTSRVGMAGDKPITVADYTAALQEQLQSLSAQFGTNISMAQAQQLGLDQAVLGQVVTQRVLDNEAATLGISAPDDRVAEEVRAVPAFQNLSGSFDREAYRDVLARNNLDEEAFEESLRDDMSRTLLQAAVYGGIAPPQTYGTRVADWLLERRTATWATVPADSVSIPAPGEEELRSYYDAHPDRYSWPERRRLAVAWLTPAMISDEVEVDEAALRELYDQRIDQFVLPERRLVERLVFPNEEAATAARARIDEGSTTFEEEVSARGLGLSDVDLGDVGQEQLGAAGEPVFAANTGDVVGPVETSLGPALFRLNAVLGAQETTFEEAMPDLRDELAISRAARVIDQERERLSDLVAGGATIADLAANSAMEEEEILWFPGSTEGIAAYESFRTAAASASEGDYPEIRELEDGGLFALDLVEVLEPELRPFDEMAAQVATDWTQAQRADALAQIAGEKAGQILAGASFAEAGLAAETTAGLTRRDFLAEAPEGFVDTLFAMPEGGVEPLASDSGVVILRLDRIERPEGSGEAYEAEVASVTERMQASLAQDVSTIFNNTVQMRTEVTIDQAAIASLNSSVQ